jgi:glycosyltransferase involved in cell wall biosynthesis
MSASEQPKNEAREERRLAARFAVLWAEHRRLAERLAAIESSTAWAVARRLTQWRRRLAPEGSRRQACFRFCMRGLRRWRREGFRASGQTVVVGARSVSEGNPILAYAAGSERVWPTSGFVDRAGEELPVLDEGKFRVAFIGSGDACEAQSMRYRAHNVIESLALAGLEGTFVTLDEVRAKLPRILSHDLIVLVRLRHNNTIAALIEAAQRLGRPLVYDIDDYLFDPWVMPYVEALRALEQADALRVVDEFGACLDRCDYFTGSTPYLAERAAVLEKKSFVVHNGLNAAQLELARLALEQRNARPRDNIIRLGYFSGTRTHQADFRIVYPALMDLLREQRNVRLMIVGDLDIGEFPGLVPFLDQMEILPLRHWRELPAVMAGIDVNLIPLELTPFNEGKSNLKYYEAGLLQTPSIASPTRINRESITHGHNGLLAQTPEEWHNALKDLVSDTERRQRMGRHAFQHVLRNYVPRAIAAEAVDVYRQILHSHGRTRGAIRQAG